MAAPRPLSLWPLSAFWSDRDPRPDPWLPQGGDLKPGLWSQTCVLSLFSRVLIFATLYSLSGSSVQARILEWVAISFSRNLPDPGMELTSLVSPALAGRLFTTESPGTPIVSYINTQTQAHTHRDIHPELLLDSLV